MIADSITCPNLVFSALTTKTSSDSQEVEMRYTRSKEQR